MPSVKYLVIGSNCFTGSHIVDGLLSDPDCEVVGVSRSAEYKSLFLPYKQREPGRFKFHQVNLISGFDDLVKLLEAERPQIVINVAALSEVGLSNERPVEYFDTNSLGVVRLCNYLRTCDYLERYVHISSAEIFGSCQDPVTEEVLFNPSTPYAVSKAAADMYLNVLLHNFDFPVSIIRSTNVYGRHQQLFKIIPRTVIYVKQGKTLELHGGGKSSKSFVHVRDVVAGLMSVIQQNRTGTYHFSVPSEVTVAGVVRQVCTHMGVEFEEVTRVVGERLGQDSRYSLDCTKAKEELGWEPQVRFEDGVGEVVDWIESNWEAVIQEPLVYEHKV
jgi:dTDP-glucose 4,6-dehydratase